MQTRPYQKDMLDSVVSSYDAGFTQQLAVMATGTGKTVCFSHLPEIMESRLPGQMWVIAHREELIDQAVKKLRACNPTLLVDKEMAEHYANPSADVIVSSIASIGRKDTKRAARFDWDMVTKVIIDEAHHSKGETYNNFLELTGVLIPGSKKLLLGVTATPNRGDGQKLSDVYKKISYVYSLRNAIEDGWLVDLRGYRVDTQTSLDNVKITAGDFQQGELSDAVNNRVRNSLIVDAWESTAQDRQTVVFTVDIKHAQDLALEFTKEGHKAAAVWGNDPDRADKLAKHRAGEITVLTNCGILTEGYDDPSISCIVLARPTKSGALYTQMVGRGTRLEEGCNNLIEALDAGHQLSKTDCLIIDICDSTVRHSLQTVPSLFGMNGQFDLAGGSALGAAKAVEQAQEENPYMNLSTLTSLSQLKAHIENVNLFDTPYPPEVESNSEFCWQRASDGSYVVLLPGRQRMTIKQNLLDQWEIVGVVHGKKYRGQRNELPEAFSAAEAVLTKIAENDFVTLGEDSPEGVSLKLLRRQASWHSRPSTYPQRGMIRKLYKGRQFPWCVCSPKKGETMPFVKTGDTCPICKAPNSLDSGRASRMINAALSKKVKV